jgi:hypothetical protein
LRRFELRGAAARLRKPSSILGTLVIAQWAAVAVFALVVEHNGWLFYQGGDETFYYTGS